LNPGEADEKIGRIFSVFEVQRYGFQCQVKSRRLHNFTCRGETAITKAVSGKIIFANSKNNTNFALLFKKRIQSVEINRISVKTNHPF
jgi:hypothetical protein